MPQSIREMKLSAHPGNSFSVLAFKCLSFGSNDNKRLHGRARETDGTQNVVSSGTGIAQSTVNCPINSVRFSLGPFGESRCWPSREGGPITANAPPGGDPRGRATRPSMLIAERGVHVVAGGASGGTAANGDWDGGGAEEVLRRC
jgi:hypothetical protein